jgi:hypothetical protein
MSAMTKIIRAQDILADARGLIGAILLMAADDSDGPGDQIYSVAGAARERIEAVTGLLQESKEGSPVAGRATEDPIFAAIERHRAAEARYGEAIKRTDTVAARQHAREITEEDLAEDAAATRGAKEALTALLATVPLTAAGARAAVLYFSEDECIEEYATDFLETLLKSPALAD